MHITLNDIELFYRIEGSGDPALVMHGGLGIDHTPFLNTGFNKLSRSLELTYYDHRCNGRSSCPGIETLTHENLAGDAEKLRAALGYEDITVIGHSYGGFTGLEYAWRYPSNLRRIVLITTAFSGGHLQEAREIAKRRAPELMDLVEKGLNCEASSDEEAIGIWDQLGPLYCMDYHRFKDQLKTASKDIIHNVPSLQHSLCNLMPKFDVRDKLAEIDVPVLIIAGRHDWITPPGQSEIMHERLPNSELVMLEDSAHWVYIEEENLFLKTVTDWLEKT